MDYIFVKLIWYVLFALLLGIGVGWFSCGRGGAGES